MANNLEDSILDYFPEENNELEEIITDEIPEDFILLKKSNYSKQFKLEIGQLEFYEIPFKLEKGGEITITTFNIFVHENDEEDAINILEAFRPEIPYAKNPKWKAGEMQSIIFYIVIGIIVLVLFFLYASESAKLVE